MDRSTKWTDLENVRSVNVLNDRAFSNLNTVHFSLSQILGTFLEPFPGRFLDHFLDRFGPFESDDTWQTDYGLHISIGNNHPGYHKKLF